MPITLTCACGKKLVAPDVAAGQKVRCPHCRAVMDVPFDEDSVSQRAAISKEPLAAPEPPPTRPFYVELALASVYPLKGSGSIILAIFSAMLALSLTFGRSIFTLIMPVATAGYLAAYYLSIVQSSAGGDNKLPELPDLTDVWDDVLQPMLLVLAAVAVSALPAIAYAIYARLNRMAPNGAVVMILDAWFAIYFPMAIMSVAVWRSASAVSPHVVLPAILRIPGRHLLMAAFVWLVWRGYVLLNRQIAGVWLTDEVVGRFLAMLLTNLAFLYFSWVTGRIIGITHWVYRRDLRWFRTM